MASPSRVTASGVSRQLSAAGFSRSRRYKGAIRGLTERTPGFSVEARSDGEVTVCWRPGLSRWHYGCTEKVDQMMARLSGIGYSVRAVGEGSSTHLVVTAPSGDA